MHDAMMTYFDAEKNAGLLLAVIGVIALALAVVFFQPRWELRSFAITLAVLAVGEIALGVGLYLRTGPQVSALVTQLSSAAAPFFSEETVRMVRVQKNFVIIQYVELAVIVIGAIVAFTQKHRFGIAGVALALLVHGAFLLAFDIVAERRGAQYLAAIEARGARR